MRVLDYYKQLSNVWNARSNHSNRFYSVSRAVRWFLYKRLYSKPYRHVIFEDRVFYCYPGSMQADMVMMYGEWLSYDILHFINAWLNQDDYFLDVGANVGLYSLLASKIVGSKIVCIEPGQIQRTRLAENMAANSCNPLVLSYCVSDTTGIAYLSRNDTLSQIVYNQNESDAISMSRIDIIVPQRIYSLFKLDVEGHELQAIKGASGLIEKNMLPAIIFELNGHCLKYGNTIDDLPNLLKSCGYTLGTYNHDNKIFNTKSFDGEDVLALSSLGIDMLKQRLPNVRII